MNFSLKTDSCTASISSDGGLKFPKTVGSPAKNVIYFFIFKILKYANLFCCVLRFKQTTKYTKVWRFNVWRFLIKWIRQKLVFFQYLSRHTPQFRSLLIGRLERSFNSLRIRIFMLIFVCFNRRHGRLVKDSELICRHIFDWF